MTKHLRKNLGWEVFILAHYWGITHDGGEGTPAEDRGRGLPCVNTLEVDSNEC